MDSTADGDDVAQPDRVGSISPPRRSQAYFRSLYKGRLDFRAIARDDPDFAAVFVSFSPPSSLFCLLTLGPASVTASSTSATMPPYASSPSRCCAATLA